TAQRGPRREQAGAHRPRHEPGHADLRARRPGRRRAMLGATVLFAATGRPPWGDGSAVTVPAPPPDLPDDPDLADCPPALAPIVRACLAPDPAARPAAARLHTWLADRTGLQPRSWMPEPIAARVAEYRVLPPYRGRFRWPRGREQ